MPSRRPIFDPDLVSSQLRLPDVLFSIQISFLFNYAFHTSYFPSRPSFSANYVFQAFYFPSRSIFLVTTAIRPRICHPDLVSLQLRLGAPIFDRDLVSLQLRLSFLFNYAFHTSYFPSRPSFSATTPSRRPIFHPDLVSLQLRLPGVLFSIQISFLFNYAFHTSYFPSRPSFSAITPSRPPIFHPDLFSL